MSKKEEVVDRKGLMNELYDATMITTGAVGVSMISKKILKEGLGTPETLKGIAKLALAVGASTVAFNGPKQRSISQ